MLPRERLSVDITSGTIFRILIIGVVAWFVYLVLDIILMLFAAIVIAAAVDPVARFLQRYRIPRQVSIVLVYLGIIILLSATVALLAGPLTEQLTQLALAIPQLLHRATDLVPWLPPLDQGTTQETVVRLGENISNLGLNVVEQTRTFFSSIVAVLFVFILAFYLAAEEDALKKFARLITPREHLPYIEQAITRAQQSIGRWVLAQLTLGVIVGCIVAFGLWIIGIPYALVLGLLAGVMEIIPVMGPIIAAIPGVIVGLAQSLTLGVVALVWYIIAQQLENHFLVPTIMRRAVGLNPLVTIVAILLGARVAGVAGVILAVPLAAILNIFLSDIFTTPAIDDELPG